MTRQRLDVVAAVLQRGDACFIQQRQPGKHMAGLWEFPGGKLEAGEAAWDGLVRELEEELGIVAVNGQPLIKLVHAYSDRVVNLDVWHVTAWSGSLQAREQQVTAWCTPDQLRALPLLPADGPVIDAIELPHRILVTPDNDLTQDQLLEQTIDAVARHDLGLCILRQPRLSTHDYASLSVRAADCLRERNCGLIVHGDPAVRARLLSHPGVVGLHVSAAQGLRLAEKPGNVNHLSMSCHSTDELSHAASIGARFALLGTVKSSASHPGGSTLGWRAFSEVVAHANLPVYAIGGMAVGDEARSRQHGGQGIAAISAFLGGKSA